MSTLRRSVISLLAVAAAGCMSPTADEPTSPGASALVTATTAFDFEDGTTMGFFGTGCCNAQAAKSFGNSTAQAFDGTRSLRIHTQTDATNYKLEVRGPKPNIPNLSCANVIVRYFIESSPPLPAGWKSPRVIAYDTDNKFFQGGITATQNLPQGQWLTQTWTVPPAAAAKPWKQIGFQLVFPNPTASFWNGYIHLDAIRWEPSATPYVHNGGCVAACPAGTAPQSDGTCAAVTQIATTLSITHPIAGQTYGPSLSALMALQPASPGPAITGTVTITVDGVAQPAVPVAVPLSIPLPLLAEGDHTFSASYSGSATHAPSSAGPVTFTVAVPD